MTVLGAVAPDNHHAVLWADSAVFRWDGSATGRHARKVAINGNAMTAGAGCGWGDLVDVAERVVHAARSFDAATERLPGELRQAALKSVKITKPDPHSFGGCAYVVIGHSGLHGRALACRFDASTLFVPVFVSLTLAPTVEVPRWPGSPEEVVELARQQMHQLRQTLPEAGPGDLTIVAIGPDGIHIHTARDFAVADAPQHEDSIA